MQLSDFQGKFFKIVPLGSESNGTIFRELFTRVIGEYCHVQ